ncbi:MAG: T9SS type B sorting domain-containing protein, partial [Sphingobacteriales bacterium]
APPPHTYATADSFRVNLIVTNNHGCSDTAFTDVFTTAEPIISFTGLLPKYCTGETVTLTSSLRGNIASYSWSNGIGIINNQPSISYQYSNESNYTVKLSATDRFCGDIETAQSTDVFKVPVINLGNDTILCPGLVIPIGVTATNGYIYTWSTGASTANIVTNPVTTTYLLQVDNNGCLGEDEITVTVLENCLVRVPGAFTPNNDGLNDVLRATNAYLAKNFLLRVYNRMGQLIFETKNPLEGWNGYYKGQPAEQGTYVWQLSYFDQGSNKAVFDKGTSILIR